MTLKYFMCIIIICVVAIAVILVLFTILGLLTSSGSTAHFPR